MSTPQITSPAGAALPTYGIPPERPGLYLGLFHGRNTPDEEMDNWGFEGPQFGPLEFAHTTYAADVKLRFERREDEQLFFPDTNSDPWLPIEDGLIVYNGKYYGDWTVFYVKEGTQ